MKQTSIQWDEAKSRIQANESALEEALAGSPALIQAVFRQRAIQLAQRPAPERSDSNSSPALIFRLARERHAIELKELAEVLLFQGCTQVPGTSSRLLGLISLRGELRPVLDLGMVLSERPCADSGFILILRCQVGLKVDAIEGLREIRPGELAQATPGHYTRGLVSETLTVLDVETILSGVFSPKEF
jgi:purine-binding chemotaxis protein CheW